MGDGILTIFRRKADGPSPQIVCRRALDCALEIADHTKHPAGGSERGMGVSLALHYGEVAYGNIGSGGRLDFTVIGSDVNLVSRIEPICKQLDQNILLSSTLAKHIQGHVVSIGEFDLKGFENPQSIFRPRQVDALRNSQYKEKSI